MPYVTGPLLDAQVNTVIARLQSERRRPSNGGPKVSDERDPRTYAEFGFSINPEQGELIYLLCRAIGAKRLQSRNSKSMG